MDYLGADELYLFVVDTNKYAGNFERDMCAHMTGVVGESEVGEESADDYRETFGMTSEDFEHNDHILQLPGEHGYNPVCIFEADINSFCIFMDRIPTEGEIERMKRRATDFVNGPGKPYKIKILGFRLFSRIVTQKELPC